MATLIIGLGAVAAPALAQSAADTRPVRRIEAGGGAGLFGRADFSAADANLRTRDGGDFRLFSTTSAMAAAAHVETRAGFWFTRRYGVEVRFGFSRPELRTSISSDAEGAPSAEVAEQIDQYIVDGAFVMMLDGLRAGPLVPFVSAGAGYLRQLHDGQTLVEQGTVYRVAGGIKHWLFARRSGLLKSAGWRADAGLTVMTGGVSLDDAARPYPEISGSLFVVF
jgi:hypothetical protein